MKKYCHSFEIDKISKSSYILKKFANIVRWFFYSDLSSIEEKTNLR